MCVWLGDFCVCSFVFEVFSSRIEQYWNECGKYTGNYFAFGLTPVCSWFGFGFYDTQLKTALAFSLIYMLF